MKSIREMFFYNSGLSINPLLENLDVPLQTIDDKPIEVGNWYEFSAFSNNYQIMYKILEIIKTDKNTLTAKVQVVNLAYENPNFVADHPAIFTTQVIFTLKNNKVQQLKYPSVENIQRLKKFKVSKQPKKLIKVGPGTDPYRDTTQDVSSIIDNPDYNADEIITPDI